MEETELYFKTGGYVKRVLVGRGDQVQAGDLLAELEIDDLLKQMAQAEVTLSSAQLRLNEAEKSLERQIAQQELDLTGATGTLYAMLHTDAGTAGTYEFPGDDKPVSVDDAIVMTRFSLQAAEGQVEVRMVDFAFAQASLFVRAGSTVTWINEDGARHTATSDTGIWDSGLTIRRSL